MTQIVIGKGKQEATLQLNMLNRHGLIAGATGTGKTVTLKVLAETLSQQGVPVFLADIKGDLSSMAKAGEITDKISQRLAQLNITDHQPKAFPVRLWDVFAKDGHPIRTTISEMGPLMLGRLLNLNDTQTGVLNIVFKIADDAGYLLIDLKDLQALLKEVADNAEQYSTTYGNIAKQTVGAIQRSLLTLEQQGGDLFFGEPALEIKDFMQTDESGQGIINILMATQLFQSPTLYATFLLWLLAELYESLPEVGDIEKPKLVFFFDEAHLLFNDAPKVFVEKVEQIVRLIRSKGVGVFFVTQNPMDLPETVLAQLGNRVQHALRAYTPKEIKAVKVAAETFRPNPDLDVAQEITQLQVGEALVSFLNDQAQPNIVEKAFIYPPKSSFSPLDPLMVQSVIANSPLDAKYREAIDRESAYEVLGQKVLRDQQVQAELEREKTIEKERREQDRDDRQTTGRQRKSTVQKATESFITSAVRTIGRELVRGIFGSLRR